VRRPADHCGPSITAHLTVGGQDVHTFPRVLQ
jgi:hypothetical protein